MTVNHWSKEPRQPHRGYMPKKQTETPYAHLDTS